MVLAKITIWSEIWWSAITLLDHQSYTSVYYSTFSKCGLTRTLRSTSTSLPQVEEDPVQVPPVTPEHLFDNLIWIGDL